MAKTLAGPPAFSKSSPAIPTVLIVTCLINHFDLFGLRQVWLPLTGRPYHKVEFRAPMPYRYVRHPIYVAGFLIVAGTPPALGSLWALIPVAVTSPTLIVRTAFEDRLLQDELGGYKEYASRAKLVRASFTSVRNEAGSP